MTEEFQELPNYLKPQNKEELTPEPSPDGTSIVEIAMAKDRDDILRLILNTKVPLPNDQPRRLFSR